MGLVKGTRQTLSVCLCFAVGPLERFTICTVEGGLQRGHCGREGEEIRREGCLGAQRGEGMVLERRGAEEGGCCEGRWLRRRGVGGCTPPCEGHTSVPHTRKFNLRSLSHGHAEITRHEHWDSINVGGTVNTNIGSGHGESLGTKLCLQYYQPT